MAKKKTSTKKLVDTENIQRHEKDTGSPEIQITLLTNEIIVLQDHLSKHSQDADAKRSLLKKVARRRKFLKYLKASKLENYQKISKKIGIKV